jgi:transcriptional regulator with PAS, ATPase and Fis domain
MTDDDQVRISTSLVRRANNMGLPFGALSAIAELKRQLQAVESLAIRKAREHGATWEIVAEALGISRQALHQRMQTARRQAVAKKRGGSAGLDAEQAS